MPTISSTAPTRAAQPTIANASTKMTSTSTPSLCARVMTGAEGVFRFSATSANHPCRARKPSSSDCDGVRALGAEGRGASSAGALSSNAADSSVAGRPGPTPSSARATRRSPCNSDELDRSSSTSWNRHASSSGGKPSSPPTIVARNRCAADVGFFCSIGGLLALTGIEGSALNHPAIWSANERIMTCGSLGPPVPAPGIPANRPFIASPSLPMRMSSLDVGAVIFAEPSTSCDWFSGGPVSGRCSTMTSPSRHAVTTQSHHGVRITPVRGRMGC